MSADATEDNCSHCLFWKMARPTEGWCQRAAPEATNQPDRIAHWPTTHGTQFCGEFLRKGAALDLVNCADCRYWRKPAWGLQPVDRGDRLASWWAQAGHCARHAPRPQSEPGPRAFWRASHADDTCAESMRRPGHAGETGG